MSWERNHSTLFSNTVRTPAVQPLFEDVPWSAKDFGEGSFDKGLYFRVPLNAIFGQDTRNYYKSRLRPIQRDGGARLEGYSGELWHSLRDARYDTLNRNKSRMKP